MDTFRLQVIATLMCLLCGALANYSVLTMSLDPTRYILANIVGIGCLPLGLFMGYTALKERKSQQGN